jgi:uncharacterized OB-fold protein
MPVPAPARTTLNAPYWDALAEGRLLFQQCDSGHRWLPPRVHCPTCLSDEVSWVEASGDAWLLSWVVYHRSFDPGFDDLVPYNVALVELNEGPRLITNIVGIADPGELEAGRALKLRVEPEAGVCLARFEPARD